MKTFFKYSFVIVALIALSRLYYHLTDDFRMGNISYTLPKSYEPLQTTLTSEEHSELASLLKQSFKYIGKGAQCYAFESDDHQYVIKFFKFKHLRPNGWITALPSIGPLTDLKERHIANKERKLINLFRGYEIAFLEDRDNSGLIFLHLTPTKNLELSAVVVDKIGLKHTIDLDTVAFMIQQRGETFRDRLSQLLDTKDNENAKISISKILDMYVNEYQRGVYDRDHGVMQNSGFIGEHPFHLDAGKFSHNDNVKLVAHYANDLKHVVWKIDFWIKMHYPKDYVDLTTFLSSEYLRLTGNSFDASQIDPETYSKKNRKQLTIP